MPELIHQSIKRQALENPQRTALLHEQQAIPHTDILVINESGQVAQAPAIIMRGQLPHNPNGKIDRRRHAQELQEADEMQDTA